VAGSFYDDGNGASAASAASRRLGNHFANCIDEIGRQRCFKIHPPFFPRVHEPKFPRMQHLPRNLSSVSSTINGIAENRMSKMLEMDTNLMRSTAVQPAFKQ